MPRTDMRATRIKPEVTELPSSAGSGGDVPAAMRSGRSAGLSS